MKNLLFIGDVVGKSGCDFLSEKIYGIKKPEISLPLRGVGDYYVDRLQV